MACKTWHWVALYICSRFSKRIRNCVGNELIMKKGSRSPVHCYPLTPKNSLLACVRPLQPQPPSLSFEAFPYVYSPYVFSQHDDESYTINPGTCSAPWRARLESCERCEERPFVCSRSERCVSLLILRDGEKRCFLLSTERKSPPDIERYAVTSQRGKYSGY